MPLPLIIAIDGPAASGKTTIGIHLADELGYLFFDTGVMYRAATWAALERHVPIEDEAAVTRLTEALKIEVTPPSQADGRNSDLLVDGVDATWAIRSPEVEASVSAVSAYPGVRTALTLQQRQIGLRGKVVMVGRDVGTVVLPEAELKIFLDASVEERARRRWEENHRRGKRGSLEGILKAMRRRDRIDSTRKVAPLTPAKDAVVLNSDGLSIEEVVAQVRKLLKAQESKA